MNREPLVQGDMIEIEGNMIRIDQEAGRGVSSVVYTGEIVQKDDSLPVKVIVKEFYPKKGFRRVGTRLQRLAVEELPAEFWTVSELFKVGYRKQNEMGNSNLMEIAVRPYLYGTYGDSEYYVSDIHLGISLEKVQFHSLKEKLDCMIRMAEVFGILHNDESGQNDRKYVMLDFAPSNILWIEKPKGVRILDADSIVPYRKTEGANSLKTTGIGDNRYTSPGFRQLKRNIDSGLSTLENELPFYARPQENVYSLGCYFYELLFGNFSQEDICRMKYGELCSRLFTAYEAELGSMCNAEALLDVVWKAVQPKFRNRQKNGRVLMEELIAVSKKINAYEYIPKKTIAQANGTFLAYNLLEEYPLFEYVSENAGKKQIHIAVTGRHKVREEVISAILCMQMLDTELTIHVIAEDAEKFWKMYLAENPAVSHAVTWSVNGIIQSDELDSALVTEKLAHVSLITGGSEQTLPEKELEDVRYIILLEETVHEQRNRLDRILQNLKRKKQKGQTEKVLLSYLQNHQEYSAEGNTETAETACGIDFVLLHGINNYKFTEEYNEEMFSRKISRMALYTHAYYSGCMNGNDAVNLEELEKELRDNAYNMASSQRAGLHSIYKLASVGIHRNALGKFLQYYRKLQDSRILEQLAWLEHRSWTAFMITKGAVPLSYEEFLQTAYKGGNNWKDVADPKHIRHPLLVASSMDVGQVWYQTESEQNQQDEEVTDIIENMDLLDQMSYRIAGWYRENRDHFQRKLDENIQGLRLLFQDENAGTENMIHEKAESEGMMPKNEISKEVVSEMLRLIELTEKEGSQAVAHIGEKLSMQDRTYIRKWKDALEQVKAYSRNHEFFDVLQKITILEQDMKPVMDSYSERDFKQLDRDLAYAVMDLLGI